MGTEPATSDKEGKATTTRSSHVKSCNAVSFWQMIYYMQFSKRRDEDCFTKLFDCLVNCLNYFHQVFNPSLVQLCNANP